MLTIHLSLSKTNYKHDFLTKHKQKKIYFFKTKRIYINTFKYLSMDF